MNKFLKTLVSNKRNSSLIEMKKRLDFVINLYEGLTMIENSKISRNVSTIPISLETYISILKYIRNGGNHPNLKVKGE